MSARIGVGEAGLVVAAIMGGWHLCWSVLVALQWAQPVIDFVFWVHFIKPVYAVEPFEFARAVILVAITAAIGFLLGAIFAFVWNAVRKA